jgi:hypothetical protein
MSRAAAVLAALALVALLAAPASAQVLLPPPAGPVTEVASSTARFTIEGEVTVTFRGEGVEGTTVVRPLPEGRLDATELATRGGRRFRVALFGLGPPAPALTLTRTVRTAPGDGPAVCTDARTENFPLLGGLLGAPVVALVGGTGLAARCPGPVPADLAAAVPAVRLPPGDLAAGPRTFSLRGDRPLVAPGLTGTVSSSLVLRLTDVRARRPAPRRRTEFVPGGTGVRVTGVAGALAHEAQVAPDAPECAELDQCGLSVTTTLASAPDAPLTGAGAISERGRRLGGFIELVGGAVSARLRRPDGTACADTAPAGSLFVTVSGGRGDRVDVALRRGGAPGGSGPFATRCGGPAAQDVGGAGGVLARGTTTRAALARPAVALRLDRGATTTGPAGRATTRADLVVTLARDAG